MKIGLGFIISFSFFSLQACEHHTSQENLQFPVALTITFIGAYDAEYNRKKEQVAFSAETVHTIFPTQEGILVPSDYREREIEVDLGSAFRHGFEKAVCNAIGKALWDMDITDIDTQNKEEFEYWLEEESSDDGYEEIILKADIVSSKSSKSRSLPTLPSFSVSQSPKKNGSRLTRAVKTAKSNNFGTKAAKKTGKKVQSGKVRIVKTVTRTNLDKEWNSG